MRFGQASLGRWLFLLAVAPASASAGETLQPVTPWKLEYRPTQCIATREYGNAGKPITFAIVPALDASSYDLLLGYRKSTPAVAVELQGDVDFGSGTATSWLLRYATADAKQTVYRFTITAAQMAQAGSSQRVRLHVKAELNETVGLDSMAEILAGLRKCTSDLQQYWNVDGERDRRIAVPPKGDVRSVFSAADYPGDALSRGQEGGAQYQLMIDEKGSVVGCHVLAPSGIPILDAMGCAIIEDRAKFSPARDAQGRPVRSTSVTPEVRWQMAR